MFQQQGSIKTTPLIIIVIIAVLIVGAAWWYQKSQVINNTEVSDKIAPGSINKECAINSDCLEFCGDDPCLIASCTKSAGTAEKGHCSCLKICPSDNNTNSALSASCGWKPNQDYGLCTMVLGYYYDGERCLALSGCDINGESAPFATIEECQRDCQQ